ncbi:type III CRISPR-associated RAMP protein Csx7 [Desulfurispora thermophila]|uniref:type III CRISPR-associated RAMP protein Csx7 n=1 Tax=Desulfurispora thermophila TaxID=265470 RepID=UPI000376AAC4|nr:CRISPR-associated RAMP protein Csx7 [Desulfurispora thermophila]
MEQIFLYDQFYNRYIITGRLRALTALHIGAPQDSLEIGAVDARVVKNAAGQPFIPGSSFKGVWRSFTEQVLRALLGEDKVCLITGQGQRCVDREVERNNEKVNIIKYLKDSYGDNFEELAREIYRQSCPACRLFGHTHLAGKVQVADLPVLPETWCGHYDLRTGVGIERDSLTKADKVLYDLEAVPAGTCFALEVVMENLTDQELEHALYGLLAWQRGELALGGRTSRGMGRVVLEDVAVRRIERRDLPKWLLCSDWRDWPALTLEEVAGEYWPGAGGERVVQNAL